MRTISAGNLLKLNDFLKCKNISAENLLKLDDFLKSKSVLKFICFKS